MRAQGPLGWFRGRLGCGEGTGGALEGPWPGGPPLEYAHWNTPHPGVCSPPPGCSWGIRSAPGCSWPGEERGPIHAHPAMGILVLPPPCGSGLRDLAFLVGWGEANGDGTWKGLTGDQPSPPTFIQPPARVWGRGRAELPRCPLSHRPRGTPAPCSCGRPHPLLGVLGEASYLFKAPS